MAVVPCCQCTVCLILLQTVLKITELPQVLVNMVNPSHRYLPSHITDLSQQTRSGVCCDVRVGLRPVQGLNPAKHFFFFPFFSCSLYLKTWNNQCFTVIWFSLGIPRLPADKTPPLLNSRLLNYKSQLIEKRRINANREQLAVCQCSSF